MNVFDYLTVWALVAHVVCLCGLSPNTFILAVCVMVGAIVHNFSWNHRYHLGMDLCLHYLPVAVLGGRALLSARAGGGGGLGLRDPATWVYNMSIVGVYVGTTTLPRILRIYRDDFRE